MTETLCIIVNLEKENKNTKEFSIQWYGRNFTPMEFKAISTIEDNMEDLLITKDTEVIFFSSHNINKEPSTKDNIRIAIRNYFDNI